MQFSELAQAIQPPKPSAPAEPEAHEWHLAKVKWYNEFKGFGFLTSPGESRDIFLHAKVLEVCGFPYKLRDDFKVKACWKVLDDGRLRVTHIKPLERTR